MNQLERFVRGAGAMPYSYVFNGEAGYLDHALASTALSAQVADAAEWHNNADEPPVLDYNLDGKPQDKYTDAPYRASDHDPVVLSLNLQGAPVDVTASVRSANSGLVLVRATGRWNGTVTVTNTGSTTLPVSVFLKSISSPISRSNLSALFLSCSTCLFSWGLSNVFRYIFSAGPRIKVSGVLSSCEILVKKSSFNW